MLRVLQNVFNVAQLDYLAEGVIVIKDFEHFSTSFATCLNLLLRII